MRYRIMRLMVMFDLPTETTEDRKKYREFRKKLINEGFYMMQYSVYVRVCPNREVAKRMIERLKVNIPPAGFVQALMVTEKQFNGMTYLAGKPKETVKASDSRMVII